MPAMTRTTRLGLFILGFLAATGVEAVRADEAYLCEDGRIVKVPLGKLEEMKRTDACIAAYYGLTPDAAPQRIETGTIAPPPAPAATAPAQQAAVPSPAPGPRPGASPAPRTTARKAPLPVRASEPPAPPRAAAGTDYRNVVLLNAGPGEPVTFRHER